MAVPPQKFRELTFQVLYSIDITDSSADQVVPLLSKELKISKQVVLEARDRANRILALCPELDADIGAASDAYEFGRIPSVERNILRLGLFELLHDDTIPPKVALTEAIRLSRKFSSAESGRFVNAILDHIYKKSLGVASDASAIASSLEELSQSVSHAKDVIIEAEKPQEEQSEDS